MRIASAIASRLRSDEAIATRIESVADARDLAERRLPKGVFQMFEAGSGSNATMDENEQAFRDVMFRPRAAVFTPERDLRTTVLGHEISMPAIVSSVGFLGIGHRDGEAGVARAAGDAGTIQFVSGVTNTPIEEIMAAATGPVFYQLYYIGGREASAPIIERVKRAGVSGLVLIVDTRDRRATARPALPRAGAASRRRSTFARRCGFAPQALAKPRWLIDYLRARSVEPQVAMGLRPDGTPMGLFEGIEKIYQQTPAWEDIPWIPRALGRPDRDQGHPHRRGCPARRRRRRRRNRRLQPRRQRPRRSVATLPCAAQIVDAVGDEIEVLMDSGVRRGTDVRQGGRARRQGGPARPRLRLPAARRRRARRPAILELFRQQIDEALGFLGVESIDDLDPSFLELPPSWASARVRSS